MPILLHELLKYKNPHVLQRYEMDYSQNHLKSNDAFRELLKYLWITQKHAKDHQEAPNDPELNFVCAMHHEMKEIDDMWHTFLLFTKDYMKFCEDYIGNYIHHIPTTDEEKKASFNQFETDFTRYLTYIAKHLGSGTLLLWFDNLVTKI